MTTTKVPKPIREPNLNVVRLTDDDKNSTKLQLPPLAELVRRTQTSRRAPTPEKLLALDPGGTTGYAVFEGTTLVSANQLPPPNDQAHSVAFLLDFYSPTHIVMEAYTIYTHKLAAHQHSDVPTLQLIGVIKYLADSRGIPYTLQSAADAKRLATDAKLKAWNIYQKGFPHATDAIRHAVYYFLAGKRSAT